MDTHTISGLILRWISMASLDEGLRNDSDKLRDT